MPKNKDGRGIKDGELREDGGSEGEESSTRSGERSHFKPVNDSEMDDVEGRWGSSRHGGCEIKEDVFKLGLGLASDLLRVGYMRSFRSASILAP